MILFIFVVFDSFPIHFDGSTSLLIREMNLQPQ